MGTTPGTGTVSTLPQTESSAAARPSGPLAPRPHNGHRPAVVQAPSPTLHSSSMPLRLTHLTDRLVQHDEISPCHHRTLPAPHGADPVRPRRPSPGLVGLNASPGPTNPAYRRISPYSATPHRATGSCPISSPASIRRVPRGSHDPDHRRTARGEWRSTSHCPSSAGVSWTVLPEKHGPPEAVQPPGAHRDRAPARRGTKP